MPGMSLGSKIEVAAEMLQCYTKFHNVLCLQQIANAADMLHFSSFAANDITLSFPIQCLPNLVWFKKLNNARVVKKVLE